MATPLRQGYYFGPTSNKKSPAGDDRVTDDRRIARRSRYWFLEEVSFVSGENMWHPTRGYWCASGGVVIVARHPLEARSSGATWSPPRTVAGTKELHLIYWNFCNRPGTQFHATAAGVSFYARFEGSRSPDNSPARLRSSRKSTRVAKKSPIASRIHRVNARHRRRSFSPTNAGWL